MLPTERLNLRVVDPAVSSDLLSAADQREMEAEQEKCRDLLGIPRR